MRGTAVRGWNWVVVCIAFGSWCGTAVTEETLEPFETAEVSAEPTTETEPPDGDTAGEPVDSDGLGLAHARVRVELTATTAYHSGHHSRTGDFGLRTNVDYEIPVHKHITVAPRIIPLMYYNENGDGDSTLFAFGIGFVLRGYSNGEEQRGWFGEGGVHLIGQTGKFEGNTGSFNFMEELGFGYMFESGWHAAVKVNHISNAGLANHNSGVNNVGLGIGFSFKR